MRYFSYFSDHQQFHEEYVSLFSRLHYYALKIAAESGGLLPVYVKESW